VPTESARGWLSFIAFDPGEGEQPTVVFYCPVCAAREEFAPRPESFT
jgi:hypothetical protein